MGINYLELQIFFILGSQGTILNNGAVSVQSASSGKNQMIRNSEDIYGAPLSNGHYLTLQSDVQYEQGSTSGTSATANGIMAIKWDLYLNDTKYKSGSKEITFQYQVKKN